MYHALTNFSIVSILKGPPDTFRARGYLTPRYSRPYDLAFAVRVGAFDGRHPRAGIRARGRIAAALTPAGKLLIDGGDPLREVDLRAGQDQQL